MKTIEISVKKLERLKRGVSLSEDKINELARDMIVSGAFDGIRDRAMELGVAFKTYIIFKYRMSDYVKRQSRWKRWLVGETPKIPDIRIEDSYDMQDAWKEIEKSIKTYIKEICNDTKKG